MNSPTPLAALNPYQRNWSVGGLVVDRSPVKTWIRRGVAGKCLQVILQDSSAQISVKMFDDAVEKWGSALTVGASVSVKGGSLRLATPRTPTSHEYELVLTLDKTRGVTRLAGAEHKEGRLPTRLADLDRPDRPLQTATVDVRVHSLPNRTSGSPGTDFVYPACSACHRRTTGCCATCGPEWKTGARVVPRLRVPVTFEDLTGTRRLTLFGPAAEEFLGTDVAECERRGERWVTARFWQRASSGRVRLTVNRSGRVQGAAWQEDASLSHPFSSVLDGVKIEEVAASEKTSSR
jgi:hypothetical protein